MKENDLSVRYDSMTDMSRPSLLYHSFLFTLILFAFLIDCIIIIGNNHL